MSDKLDPKILGQLLVMQSIVNNLPDTKSIFSFVCKGLLDIPGTKNVVFHIETENNEIIDTQISIPVTMEGNFFGNLVFELSDPGKFQPYEDYLRNFVFMLGVILDERKQRKLNEEHKLLLEQRILERTQELKFLNDEYYSLNEELTENLEILQNTNLQLEIAKQKAEESDRLKSAFLQNMSHEIRTPMNAIMGFSELLVKNFNNKAKLEQYSQIINSRCNDLLDIINDILDIAKIESGLLHVNLEECNINALFEDLTMFFKEHQKRINKEHINFNLNAQLEPSDIYIVTDKVKLKQILINLISNALKFTQKGFIIGTCIRENNNLNFYITDTGVGIPVDKQKIIFERFYQLKDTSANLNVGGTGLGLPIVKGLVNLLGGDVFVKSEPDKGSTFSFSIPFVTAQKPLSQPPKPSKQETYKFPNKTILIVEDDKFNAEYIKEILTSNGIKYLYAANGQDAVKIALNNSVDLILMDIRLPDMDGYEASKIIKNEKKNIKIIAQTAYASIDDKQKAIDIGCSDYLSKPTKEELLLSTVYKHLV